jgi:uncharacterized phiE125 gp8 family phage protein
MISDADLLAHTRAESTETAYLRKLEKAAIEAIQQRTGRYYGATATLTEYLTWRGWPMRVANEPATLATFQSWDGTAWQTVDASTYYLQGPFIFWNSQTAPTWSPLTMPARYRVTYAAGYTAAGDVWAAPVDIQQAVLLLVGHWFENREAVVVGESGTAELPLAVSALLDPHTRVAV